MEKHLIKFKGGLLVPRDTPYSLTMESIWDLFGRHNATRRSLYEGLSIGVKELSSAGVQKLILGGSFISQKDSPSDVDMVWWYSPDMNFSKLKEDYRLNNTMKLKGRLNLDIKVDGIKPIAYSDTNEASFRINTRLQPIQDVGIVQICLENQHDQI